MSYVPYINYLIFPSVKGRPTDIQGIHKRMVRFQKLTRNFGKTKPKLLFFISVSSTFVFRIIDPSASPHNN